MTNTKAIVLARVRAIHFMRPFVSTGALCVAFVLVSLYAVSREVWVEMVLRNMPSPADLGAFVSFFAYAFMHTGLMVQVFSALALISALFLMRESLRALPFFSPARA